MGQDKLRRKVANVELGIRRVSMRMKEPDVPVDDAKLWLRDTDGTECGEVGGQRAVEDGDIVNVRNLQQGPQVACDVIHTATQITWPTAAQRLPMKLSVGQKCL